MRNSTQNLVEELLQDPPRLFLGFLRFWLDLPAKTLGSIRFWQEHEVFRGGSTHFCEDPRET